MTAGRAAAEKDAHRDAQTRARVRAMAGHYCLVHAYLYGSVRFTWTCEMRLLPTLPSAQQIFDLHADLLSPSHAAADVSGGFYPPQRHGRAYRRAACPDS